MKADILVVENRSEVLGGFQQISWNGDARVEICSSAREAFSYLKDYPADFVYFGNRLPDLKPGEFVAEFSSRFDRNRFFLVLLSDAQLWKERVEEILSGIDDYLLVPVEPEEVLVKARLLYAERFPEEQGADFVRGFAGDLKEMGLWQVLQTLHLGKKTGIIYLRHNGRDGRIYFQEGEIWEVELGALRGWAALERMLTWEDGFFRVRFENFERRKEMEESTDRLLLKASEVLEEWKQLRRKVKSMETQFEVFQQERLPQHANEPFLKLMPLLTRGWPLRKILEHSPFPEIETMRILLEAREKGWIGEVVEKSMISGLAASSGSGKVPTSAELSLIIREMVDGLVRQKSRAQQVVEESPELQHLARLEEEVFALRQKLLSRSDLQYLKRKLLEE